jgi:hypothetical protein
VEFLARYQILEECFNKNSHPEIMRKTSDILKFLARESSQPWVRSSGLSEW